MTMTVTFVRRLSTLVLSGGTALILIAASPSPAWAQQVVVMVNGDPITNFDIEQRSKLLMLSTHKQPERKDVVNELIDEKVKLKEGKKFSIDPSASDVDQSYSAMAGRMRISPDALTKSLEGAGIRPDTLKARIKTDMVWSNLIRGRYKESLQVGEKEVAAAAGEDEKSSAQGVEYKMHPIVLIVPRGSSPEVTEARKKEAEALRARIQSCTEANAFFKAMPNAAIRESVSKTSADIPPALREILDGIQIGHLTPPEVTKQGVEMVVLCAREPT